jgi:hypothetical protein
VDKFEARVRALLEFKNRWGGLVLKQGERAVAAANALGKTPQKETVRQAPEATVSFAINNHLDITKRHTPPCTTRIHHGKALKTGYGALRDSVWPSEDGKRHPSCAKIGMLLLTMSQVVHHPFTRDPYLMLRAADRYAYTRYRTLFVTI